MTIIVFLVDTSASMNQRAYLGGRPTLLDLAKSAVETFVKIRQRSPESRQDRYMLLSFEDPPLNIKAGWKENLGTFQTELKNLEATCVTQLGASLKNTFDMLNVNRMQTGIDMYGMGRFPYFLEPTMIITITDGGRLYNSNQAVQDELKSLPQSSIPGGELTKDAFRWDQRLFSLVLRLAGTPPIERGDTMVPSDSSPIDNICELTGGRSYAVTSYRTLMQCIDSLVQKVQNGVVIHFEKIGPDPPPAEGSCSENETETKSFNKENSQNCANDVSDGGGGIKLTVPNGGTSRPQTPTTILSSANTAWHKSRKLIYVPKSAQKGFAVGFWPIPETFWPDPNAPTLPPRTAHPEVKFACTNQEPMVIENLPFDKYELEPSPLTQYILSRRQSSVCWQVFVANSYKNCEVSHPFGYLKASTNLQCVNLFVMPYNYPVLLPLLEDLFKVHRMKPTKEWKVQFESYLRNMPAYYVPQLRRALQRMNAPTGLVPESSDNGLSYSIHNYLRRLKNQAKQEYDKLCAEVSKRSTKTPANSAVDGLRVQHRTPLAKEVTSHPCLQAKFQHLKDQLSEFNGFIVRTKSDSCNPRQRYRNPFDIPRHCLLEQLVRMRNNFLQPTSQHTRLLGDDQLHSLPIGQMGNYQDYLKRMQAPLREIESTPVRQHMFGNPFKIDKRMMVDEADIDVNTGGGSGTGGGKSGTKRGQDSGPPSRPQKRKPGPLPRDIKFKRVMYSAPSTEPVVSEEEPTLEVEIITPVTPPVPVVDLTNSVVDLVTLIDDSDDDKEISPVPPVFPNVVDYSDPEFHGNTNGYLFGTDLPQINHIGEKKNNNNNHVHARKANKKLRHDIYKEVRRPGKCYTKLLSLLKKVEGPLDLQLCFLEDIKKESLRFKRKKMADVIDECIIKAKNGLNNGLNR